MTARWHYGTWPSSRFPVAHLHVIPPARARTGPGGLTRHPGQQELDDMPEGCYDSFLSDPPGETTGDAGDDTGGTCPGRAGVSVRSSPGAVWPQSARVRSLQFLYRLDQRGDSHAATNAQCGNPALRPAAAHLVDQGYHYPHAGAPYRVAQCNP